MLFTVVRFSANSMHNGIPEKRELTDREWKALVDYLNHKDGGGLRQIINNLMHDHANDHIAKPAEQYDIRYRTLESLNGVLEQCRRGDELPAEGDQE